MALTPGTTLGSYQVTAKIGEGGMGEVSSSISPVTGCEQTNYGVMALTCTPKSV